METSFARFTGKDCKVDTRTSSSKRLKSRIHILLNHSSLNRRVVNALYIKKGIKWNNLPLYVNEPPILSGKCVHIVIKFCTTDFGLDHTHTSDTPLLKYLIGMISVMS